MALTKLKKTELVDAYTNALKSSQSAAYLSFKGISVAKTMEFRKKLFSEGMYYQVVKKTLWDRATTATGVKGDVPAVAAEMAVVYGNDLLTPARMAAEFAKENKGLAAIVGGIFDGEFKDAAGMQAVAAIPPREVLLSQLAYLLKSPMQRIAIAVNEVAKQKAA